MISSSIAKTGIEPYGHTENRRRRGQDGGLQGVDELIIAVAPVRFVSAHFVFGPVFGATWLRDPVQTCVSQVGTRASYDRERYQSYGQIGVRKERLL